MATSKQELKRIVENLTEEDLEEELNILSKKPKKVAKELEKVTDKLTEEEVQQGIKRYGSGEQFLQAIVMYLAFKAALIKRGVQVGVAAGAGAAILFGAGSLAHSVADATGVAAIEEIGCGIDMAGEFCQDVSDAGIEVAAEGAGFFSDLLDGIGSLFG